MRTKSAVVIGLCFIGITVGGAGQLEREFRDESLGYALLYPTNWMFQRPSPFTVVFSGRPGTDAYFATVTIENIASSRLGGGFDSVLDVANDYKCQRVTAVGEICIYGQDAWTWRLEDGRVLEGIGFMAEYPYQGTVYKTFQVIFPHENGTVFCSWAYTAPEADYATFQGIADAMFESWTYLTSPPGSTSSSAAGTSAELSVLLDVTGRIHRLAATESEFSLGRKETREYAFSVPSPGYLACILVDEAGQWIGATVYDESGERVAGRAGTASSIYGGVYEIAPGPYRVLVSPEKAFDESDFRLIVVFRRSEFSVDILVPRFGDPNQVLP